MKKQLVFAFLSLVIFANLVFVSADANDGFHCGMWGGMIGSYGIGMGLFSWLFGALILIALVLLIVWLIKQIQNPPVRTRRK